MSEFTPNNHNSSLSNIDNLLVIDDDSTNSPVPHNSQKQLDPETLLLTKHTLATSPWSRLLIISVPFGFGFIALFFLLNGFFHPQQDKIAQQPQQQPAITESAQLQNDDGDARAKLALSDQADELGKINQPADQDSQPLPSTKTQKVVSTPPAPQTVPRPSPRQTYRPSSRVVAQPTSTIKVNSTPKPSHAYSSPKGATVTRQIASVDPTAEFNRLRSIGSYGVIAYASTENPNVNTTNSAIPTLDPLDPLNQGANSNLQLPGNSTGNFHHADISTPQQNNTPDSIEQIRPRFLASAKNSKPDKYLAQENQILNEQLFRYLTVGEEASGVLVTPIVKQPSTRTLDSGQPDDGKRFVARLTQDLHDNYGAVAISVGSLLAVTVVSVDAGNYAQVQVTSILKDNTEYPIPDGAISVHGKGGQPLIAKKFQDKGGEIAQYDMTVGLVGGLAKVGEIINRPDVQQSIQTGFGGGYSNTTIQNNRRNLGAAFLEGAFGKLGDIVSSRAARSTQEILSRPNVWYIPQGTKVSFIVNRTLELP